MNTLILEFWPDRDARGNVRARSVMRMVEEDENGNQHQELVQIPLVGPPPALFPNVKQFDFCFLDKQVLEFIQNASHVVGGDCLIRGFGKGWPVDDPRIQPARQLLSLFGDKIHGLDLFYYPNHAFHFFVQNFADFIANMQFLSIFPAIEDFDFLFQWLANPRADGKQKILEIIQIRARNPMSEIFGFIQRLREEFIASNQRVNYFISIRCIEIGQIAEFTVDNVQTGETLVVDYQVGNPAGHDVCIIRHPKGEDQWKEMAKQSVSYGNKYQKIRIVLEDEMELGEF